MGVIFIITAIVFLIVVVLVARCERRLGNVGECRDLVDRSSEPDEDVEQQLMVEETNLGENRHLKMSRATTPRNRIATRSPAATNPAGREFALPSTEVESE